MSDFLPLSAAPGVDAPAGGEPWLRVVALVRRHPAAAGAGGAEVWADEVLAALAGAGVQVVRHSAALPAQRASQATSRLAGHSAGVDHFGGGTLSTYRTARKFVRRHSSAWRDLPTVVLDEINTVPFGTPRRVGLPVVAVAHQVCADVWDEHLPAVLAAFGRRVAEPIWLRRYAKTSTATVSPSSAADLQSYGLGDVRVLPQGSASPALPFPLAKSPHPTVVICGRLVASKRPWLAAAAVEKLNVARSGEPAVTLVIVGAGEAAVLQRVREAAPNTPIEVTGWVDQVTRERRVSTAWVHMTASVREGWGLVVSEAAALGTPTIALSAPGLIDSVPVAQGAVWGNVLVEASWRRPAPSRPWHRPGKLDESRTVEALAEALQSALAGSLPSARYAHTATGIRAAGVLPWCEVALALLPQLAAAAKVAVPERARAVLLAQRTPAEVAAARTLSC